jgi:1-aminocyclopropane-1-carboxylate deaminase/D-cysteine desulfhydrase-like pyridoxal-dependent ACC family enzyme
VGVIREGAGEAPALLGLIRLATWLAACPQLAGAAAPAAAPAAAEPAEPAEPAGPGAPGAHRPLDIVVDSGTGTTATGVALGAALLGLPWRVVGVMLAGQEAYYRQQQERLVAEFLAEFEGQLGPQQLAGLQLAAGGSAGSATAASAAAAALPLAWCQRPRPRRFGKVLPGELRQCHAVAMRSGVLLDPIYTLAAWEVSWQLAGRGLQGLEGGREVVMLHTGGHMGLHGLAQRFPEEFD